MALPYPRIASELLAALRGRRSQRAFSKRLGYKSNVAYRWEAARTFPTAAEALRAAGVAGVDVRGALTTFLRSDPAWLVDADPSSPAAVASFLRELRGRTPMVKLAERASFNRFAIARWVQGKAEPRLPEFLELIELSSFRLLDFLALLTDVSRMPSVAEPFRKLQAARNAAFEHPWAHAVLRALELESYRALGRHREGWIAERLGMPADAEHVCLRILKETGQIRKRRGLWEVQEASVVDTSADRQRGRVLKRWWMGAALERFDAEADGIFGYNLMAISAADWPRLRELHGAYFQAMRNLVAESRPSDRVVLFCAQLLPLDGKRR